MSPHPLVTPSWVVPSLVVIPNDPIPSDPLVTTAFPVTPSPDGPIPWWPHPLVTHPSLSLAPSPEGDRSDVLPVDTAAGVHEGLIQPRKVPNPMRESRSYRELHRELLFSHSR